MTVAGKAELQLFIEHTIGPILFVRILEVTFGKTHTLGKIDFGFFDVRNKHLVCTP
jgi:hypothetical protein